MRSGRILHYDILGRLGAGAMGEVFLAEDTRLGRRVVLKFLSLPESDGHEARARLEREARALAALSHPHIARVFALESAGDVAFLVIEHVDGETLAEALSLGPLSPSEVAHIGAAIAGALAHAHSLGVVHRDVKPENVLVTEDGHVRLSDFGIAALARGESAADGRVWGTPEYMSPEQARGDALDHRCDQYALGVTLVEALTGESPRPDLPPAEALAAWRARGAGAAVVAPRPGALERVLLRCVQRDPALRYPDCGALHADFMRVTRQLEGRAANPLPRAWLAIAAVALVAAGAFAASALLRPAPPAAPGRPRTLAVRRIDVLGGNPGDAYVGNALSEAIAMGLRRAHELRVLPVAGPGDTAVAADLVMGGSLRRERGMNHVSIALTDRRAGRVVATFERDADDRQMSYLARAIADDVVRQLASTSSPRYDYFLYGLRSEALGLSPIASAAVGALRRGDRAGGERWTEELVLHFPRECEAHVLRAYTLLLRDWRLGLEPQARGRFLAELDAARALDPRNPWPDALDGLMLHRSGYVAAAERRLDPLVDRGDLTDAARGFLLSLRGQARRDLDRKQAALEDLEAATRLDPTNTAILVMLSETLGLAGQHEASLVRARQAIALDPESGQATIALGRALSRLERWDEAIPHFERACHRLPERFTLAQAALCMMRAGHADEAASFRTLAEDAPATDWGDFELARVYALAGERARAVRLLEDANRRGRADPAVLTTPEFDPLRSDPDFRRVLAQMRLRWSDPEPYAGEPR